MLKKVEARCGGGKGKGSGRGDDGGAGGAGGGVRHCGHILVRQILLVVAHVWCFVRDV